MIWLPPQFYMPVAQLHPYLRECVRDLEHHGFCIVHSDLILDKGICTHDQLEMFREACRNVSNEKDRNLIVDDLTAEPDLLIQLAPKGKDGSMPEEYVEDKDGKGVMAPKGEPLDQSGNSDDTS